MWTIRMELRLFIKPLKYSNYRYCSIQLEQFVPKHNPVNENDIRLLERFIFGSKKLLILTGAGISTESGIPDYRSEVVGLYARKNHKPIQHMEFIKSASIRQRYWARNFVGWNRFSKCEPNAVHYSVTNLEKQGIVQCIVTQNVDHLHYKAESNNVIELHGTGFRVICLQCLETYDRHYIQRKLMERNNMNFEETSRMIRPDGDVELPEEFSRNFIPPSCESCNGILKPDIVFFGGNVPKERVEQIKMNVSVSNGLLILGSSLSVFSGYRIFLQAMEENKNICIVNIGATRADKQINSNVIKIEAKCGDILPKVC